MKEVMGTEHLSNFIKNLLSLEKNSTFITNTIEETFALKFIGNPLKVKKDLYKWIERRIK